MRELGRRTEAAKVVFSNTSPTGRGRGPREAWEGEGDFKSAPKDPHPNPLPGGEGAPLLTLHKVGARMEIAAACPAAQALGLTPGMAATQARILVTGLDMRDADPEGDHAFLTRLALFAARRWTPRACLSDTNGLFLDIGGTAHLFGGEERMCRRILTFCRRLGVTARIAVAGTAGAAHALARHGRTPLILCPQGREADAIAPFALSALRLDEDALAAARRLGVDTVGELIAMPRAPLNRRFGKALLTRLDQALGRVGEPMDPIVPEEAPSATLRLLEPIATAQAIEQVMRDLMAMLVEQLQQEGLGLRLLEFAGDRVDGDVQRITVGTARATREGAHLARLLAMKIDRIEPGFGIEAMRLTALRCELLAPQPIDGEMTGARPAPDIAELVDRLAGRIGAKRLHRPSALESDVPERSVQRIHPLSEAAEWPSWPRPVRLLARPEQVESIMALLPDGVPRQFIWRGRPYQVRRTDGPERIYGEWWRRTAEAEAVRDYFQVEDEHGARFWLFRKGDGLDPRTGDLSWWLQGMFA